MLKGEKLARAIETGLNFIGDKQSAVLVTQARGLAEIPGVSNTWGQSKVPE